MNKLLLSAAVLALTLGASAHAMADHHGEGKEGKHGGYHQKMDTDENGVVTKAEFLAAQEDHFAKLDADGNGEISKEEFKAQRDAMKDKMKERREKRKEMKDAE